MASAGRFDLVVRSLMASLKLGTRIRKEVRFIAVLEGPPDPPLVIDADGALIDSLPDSELETGQLLLAAMRGEEIPGIRVYKSTFKTTLRSLRGEFSIYYLHENGEDIRKLVTSGKLNVLKPAFILGDHIGIDRETESYLDSLKIPRVSLGPIAYLTSQCIIIVNEELDRALNIRD